MTNIYSIRKVMKGFVGGLRHRSWFKLRLQQGDAMARTGVIKGVIRK